MVISFELICTCFRDFQLSCDKEQTYLSKIHCLLERHNEIEFWEVSKGVDLLAEIKDLLAQVPSQADVIESLVEACSPYNYSLIQALLLAGAESSSKVFHWLVNLVFRDSIASS